MKNLLLASVVAAGLFLAPLSEIRGQGMDKALITHQSESIGIAPLMYGVEKGFYRREGVDLQFRILRSDLAVSAIIGSREVDYMYGAGTAFRAGAKGLPIRILSHDIKSVLHYLMVPPSIQSAKDLKGKKVAIGSLGGTNMAAARASIKALGLDADKDVTYIVIGAASIRMAASGWRSTIAPPNPRCPPTTTWGRYRSRSARPHEPGCAARCAGCATRCAPLASGGGSTSVRIVCCQFGQSRFSIINAIGPPIVSPARTPERTCARSDSIAMRRPRP